MVKIVKNGTLYDPSLKGKRDIMIMGDKIAKVGESFIESSSILDIEVIDAEEKLVVPGLIDQHVHLIGGGGEGGFHSRTPEVSLSQLVRAGVTTVVGLLGTDGVARHAVTLLAKAKGLDNEGISTYIYSGSYSIPPVTITGDLRKDIMFIDKVLGVKTALSDHRSCGITREELIRLASEVRVAAMLSEKHGVVHIHMGHGKDGMKILFDVLDKSDIPIHHFVPTHVTRNRELFAEALEFARQGGTIDITTLSTLSTSNNNLKPVEAIQISLESGISSERITMSSDGNGSVPRYNEKGELTGIKVAELKSLYLTLVAMVKAGIKLEKALSFMTSNVASILGIYPQKGCLKPGSDADLLILDKDLTIDTVIARGEILLYRKKLLRYGIFDSNNDLNNQKG